MRSSRIGKIMATIVGIVYSPNQLRRRRVVVSDDADEHVMAHALSMQPGEKFLTIDRDTYAVFNHPDQLDDHIATLLGGPKLDHTCAVVAGDNSIVAVVGADPRIDDHPLGVLIQDEAAETGLTYDLDNAQVAE